jgi:hypothetical protein
MATDAAPGPELRDIHLPAAPSWWPPAPGWWILAGLLIIALVFAARWLLARHRERRWRQRILGELDRIASGNEAQPDGVRLAAEVSQLLRRASILIEPRAAALRDEAWLGFLDGRLAEPAASAAPFRTGVGRALVDAPYRRADDPALPAVDAHSLIALARSWLVHALPRRRDRA